MVDIKRETTIIQTAIPKHPKRTNGLPHQRQPVLILDRVCMILYNAIKYTSMSPTRQQVKNMSIVKQGYNQGSIQNMNRTLLINLLRKQGVCSRSTLAEMSGLKQATVTYIMNDFMHWNLVKETGYMSGLKGRRSIGITINTEDFGVIGVRIARRNFSVGLFDLSGKAVQLNRENVSEGDSSRDTFERIKTLIRQMLDEAGERRVMAIGAALPGPYNFRSGRIELMTGVPGWSEIQVEEELKETFLLPTFVEQDANASVIAQYWHSDEQDLNDKMMVYITDGQGVGAGILNQGQLVKGSFGAAGEIGHTSINFEGPVCTCGNRGCLEGYCSTGAFTDLVNASRSQGEQVTFEEAVELTRRGDAGALGAFLKCCDYLSVGVVNVINTFNPDFLMIGDEMAHILPEMMRQRITENARKHLIPQVFDSTRIMMSVVEEDSMVHGAAIVAIRELFDQTEQYFGEGVETEDENE